MSENYTTTITIQYKDTNDTLDLAFDKGLTVLTGETGAGKSILLDALDALFAGSKSLARLRLRSKESNKGLIEASFNVSSDVKAWLQENQLYFDESEILISREWHFNNNRLKNRCRINGLVVNKLQINSLVKL